MSDLKPSSSQKDAWTAGALYEPYVGRWSRLVAAEFVPWLGVPSRKRWLDIGCGTGALTQRIVTSASPSALKAIDPSPHYLAFAREHVLDSRVQFELGTTDSLRPGEESFDAVVSGLVLNFIPDPARALAHIKSVTAGGGIIGAFVWDYAGKMELMRYFWDAAVALDPTARELDEGNRFPLCKPGPLEELFAGAGLKKIELRSIDVPTHFRDFGDYWSPFLSGQGPAPGYAMSLTEERRGLLRDDIRRRLPVAADGSIGLTARAWAIRGSIA